MSNTKANHYSPSLFEEEKVAGGVDAEEEVASVFESNKKPSERKQSEDDVETAVGSHETVSSSLQAQAPDPVIGYERTSIAYMQRHSMSAPKEARQVRATKTGEPGSAGAASLSSQAKTINSSTTSSSSWLKSQSAPGADELDTPRRPSGYAIDNKARLAGSPHYSPDITSQKLTDEKKFRDGKKGAIPWAADHSILQRPVSARRAVDKEKDLANYPGAGKRDEKVSTYSPTTEEPCPSDEEEGSIPSSFDCMPPESVTTDDSLLNMPDWVIADEMHMPGAHHIAGNISVGLESVEEVPTQSPSDSNISPPNESTSPDSDTPPAVEAELVDTEEEEQRIRDLEEQNRMLREQQQSAVIAKIVSKGEILKSVFNLGDPEFRRQRRCGFGFLLLALAAIVIGVVLTRPEPPPSTPAPTPEPTTLDHLSLSEFLSDVSFDGGAALFNQSTPQYQAVKWLANNNTNLDNYMDMQKIQRYVLATLYFSTNGGNWTTKDHWLDDGPECGRWSQKGTIQHLSCTSEGEVSNLVLEGNGLQGMIPPELALLSNSLEHLSLRENKLLAGTVPFEFQYLTLLRTLDVDDNILSGTIIAELGLLTRLSFLGMSFNKFTGTIPTELFGLKELVTMRLGGDLQGTIPSLVGKLTGLSQLWLGENPQLGGTIPSTIGLLTGLTDLSLWSNSLAGTIPSTVGYLSSLGEI